jgi:hypothetical protein
VHGIGDLTLTLPSAPKAKLTHTDYVALDTRCISEPLITMNATAAGGSRVFQAGRDSTSPVE